MNISIQPLKEADLPVADNIFRLAFGTLHGLPDPFTFGGDTDPIRTRWRVDPTATLGAKINGELVGSNFVTNWGSVGVFGPLTVHPDLWGRRIAQSLLEATMALFDRWGVRHAGLSTFPNSPKHVALYQKFGFWPRFLIAIMSLPVGPAEAQCPVTRYSKASDSEKGEILDGCRKLTDANYEGLDVSREILSVESQRLGDTLLLREDSVTAGFAVCHLGPRTEAGSDTCKIKFGAVRPGPNAGDTFDRLIRASEAYAASRGVSRLTTTVNTARHEAYRRLLSRGFRTELISVSMCKPNEPGYNRPDVFVVDEWR